MLLTLVSSRLRIPSISKSIPVFCRPSIRAFSDDCKPLPKWSSLTSDQRSAWRKLGCNPDVWQGSEPPASPLLRPFAELSAEEKSIVLNGLRMNRHEWELHRVRFASFGSGFLGSKSSASSTALATPSSSSALATVGGGALSTVAQAGKNVLSSAWSVAQKVLPVIAPILKVVAPTPGLRLAAEALSHVNTISEAALAPIQVNGLETVLYLDDSASMTFGSNLGNGRQALESMVPKLGNFPIRVLKFGMAKQVLFQREQGLQPVFDKVSYAWDGSSGSTYMWHMIQEDVLSRYRPGSGKLRLCIITDGHDLDSPHGYQGLQGMNPLMRTLREARFDIEWFIIVLDNVQDAHKYRALAHATGGEYLNINDAFNPNHADVRRFMSALESSSSGDERRRRERQEKYELEARAGRAEKFDWYTPLQLPPSPSDKPKK